MRADDRNLDAAKVGLIGISNDFSFRDDLRRRFEHVGLGCHHRR